MLASASLNQMVSGDRTVESYTTKLTFMWDIYNRNKIVMENKFVNN